MSDLEQKIIVSIGVDGSEAASGIKQVQTGLTNLNNTPVDKPIQSLKAQLKEANIEAQKMQVQFGRNSTEFIKAAKHMAEIKDQFDEYKQSVASFNPDNKLQAITSLAKGATGAIGGITGGMTLLGIESENAQETMKRLQALMVFSDALNSVDDIKNSFKNLGLIIKSSAVAQGLYNAATATAAFITKLFGASVDTTSTSFKGLRAAIIGTGIGALIIGVVALVQNFDKLKTSLGFASKAQEAFKEASKEANKSAGDEAAKAIQSVSEVEKAFKDAAKGVITKKDALDTYNKTLGATMGATSDVAVAEKKLAENKQAFIDMTMAKAAAMYMLQKAAEAQSKALTAANEDQTSWIDKGVAGLKGLVGANADAAIGLANAQNNKVKKIKEDSDKEVKLYTEEANKKFGIVADKEKQLGIVERNTKKEGLESDLKHNENQLKIAQAGGKDITALQKKNYELKKQLAEGNKTEIEGIQAEETAFEVGRAKMLADSLKEQRLKLKDHVDSMQKIQDEAFKVSRDTTLDAHSKELNDNEAAYQDQKKATQKQTEGFIKDLKQKLKEHKLSQEEFNSELSTVNKKQGDVEVSLVNEKNAKEVEINKKYLKQLKEFRAQYEETEYQRQREKLIEDFNEQIKLIDAKDTEGRAKLAALRDKQVNKLDTQETLRKETINKETTLVDVQKVNEIDEKDTPEVRLQKLKSVHDAETQYKDAQYQEEKEKLAGQLDELKNLKAKHEKDVHDTEKAYSESKKEIHRLETEQKVSELKVLGNAGEVLSDLVGKQTIAGKGLAIASALINTYAGATEVIKAKSILPEPFATIQKVASVATIIATGMKNVKAIAAVQVPAKGGGGAGGATIPSAPTINSTALNPDQTAVRDVRVTNPADQAPVKAYIVSSELQDHQDKTNFINKLSTF